MRWKPADQDRPAVFISYSHRDKDFARQLDASLIARSVKTFLDEREIQVGDPIPEKIYDGIAASTHLVYVISASSVNSRWVQEELSIAKMIEKESEGFKILPVLIDEIRLPTAVTHVRYADFREWRDPISFRGALLEILQAMHIEPRLVGREELKWYAKHALEIRHIHLLLVETAAALVGALEASQSVSYDANPHIMTTKWVVRDEQVVQKLSRLRYLLQSRESSASRLNALELSITEAIDYGREELYSLVDFEDYRKVDKFSRFLDRIARMVGEMRSEFEDLLLAADATT